MSDETPRWVADAVFYQIFPDRFATSAALPKPHNLEPWDAPPTLFGFKGGDLDGVREHLDHIEELGATALYLNPIFASTANHRYHTHDYYRVDPILGGDAAFARLLADAHARGLRVVIDGVFNHASRGFYQFNHTLENGARSPYVDWFHFNQDWLAEGRAIDAYGLRDEVRHHAYTPTSYEHYGYAAWWNLPALPKLNTDNPDVREFLFGVAEHWIRFGADGWRLDVPSEIDDADFWREFRRRVHAVRPDAYIVGEIWDDATRWLAGDQFDGVTNYLFARATLGFVFGERLNHAQLDRCGLRGISPQSAEATAASLESLWRAYPRAAAESQLNLVGSHDTPRIMTSALGDEAGVRLTYLLLFAFPGAPCIYYGDEVGLPGNHDPDNRRAFDWDRGTWNGGLFGHIRACIAARRRSDALRRGDLGVLRAQGRSLVLFRKHGDSEAIVAVNAGLEPTALQIPLGDSPLAARAWTPILPMSGELDVAASGEATLSLPPRSGQIWLSP